jgi:hypothetical protein
VNLGGQEPDPIPLPTLYEATIDDELLEALFVDVESLCILDELRVRPIAGEQFSLPPADLTDARERLVRREIASIQLRYCHEGQNWLDTVTATPVGYRLVRMGDPLSPE